MADIIDAYREWSPPMDVHRVIRPLVESVPERYLAGLHSIVLTNASGLSRDRRRAKTHHRKRKVRVVTARGLYHQAWQGRPASIELFVDNILTSWPRFFLRLRIVQDFAFGEVIFHEVGHHIHRTHAPEFREREDVADMWRDRLMRLYFHGHYQYLILAGRPFRWVMIGCRWLGLFRKPARRS